MSDLRVYLAQVNQFWEDKRANLKHLDSLFSEIDFKKDSLLLIPEMFNTSFTTNPETNYEIWEDSNSIEWLQQQSLKNCIAIGTSLIIKEGEDYYNRFLFIENGKLKYHYDKIKLFSLAGEHRKFSPGVKTQIIEYRGWRILTLICYDLRFPELARIHKGDKYDLLVYVANWPMKRIAHWDKLLQARAIENLSYCAAVNRVGMDGNAIEYNGSSKVLNPNGEEMINFSDFEEAIKFVDLRKEYIDTIRDRFGFLNDIE